MKNISEIEDRSNDWLAKELEREKEVSSFDFGEGKRLRQIHISHNHHVKRNDLYHIGDKNVSLVVAIAYALMIIFMTLLIMFIF